ncbi:MAG: 50S ribosomal protein L18 [bacterium]|nr:50S ribosomal protein L18 [bacterium]
MAYNKGREKRHARVRAKVSGTTVRPRIAVFRSNVGLYAQLIDDTIHSTLLSVKTAELGVKINKVEQSKLLGELIAKKAKEKNICSVVFDRGGYRYHGRVKAFAEAARAGGLQF